MSPDMKNQETGGLIRVCLLFLFLFFPFFWYWSEFLSYFLRILDLVCDYLPFFSLALFLFWLVLEVHWLRK
jgi:hypothetical protein